jgi:hypothetical protein
MQHRETHTESSLERGLAVAITAIQRVINERNGTIVFRNMESSGNDRIIAPGDTVDVGGAWVPWCTNNGEFPAHHIQIEDCSGTKLFYVWQRNANDGDFVRVSETGFENPGKQVVAAGGSIGLLRIGASSPRGFAENADNLAGGIGVTIDTNSEV